MAQVTSLLSIMVLAAEMIRSSVSTPEVPICSASAVKEVEGEIQARIGEKEWAKPGAGSSRLEGTGS